jgi:hypothetical protein
MFAPECHDRQGKHITDAALGLDDTWSARRGLQLTSQPEDLHVDAAVGDIFMYACRIQKKFTSERRMEKGDQQGIFKPPQHDGVPLRSIRRRLRRSRCQSPNRKPPRSGVRSVVARRVSRRRSTARMRAINSRRPNGFISHGRCAFDAEPIAMRDHLVDPLQKFEANEPPSARMILATCTR